MTHKYVTTRYIAYSALARSALLLALALSLVGLAPRRTVAHTQAARSAQTEQDGELDVIITHVDSDAFPAVTAYVTVSGEDGLPVEGLTAGEFALQADGLQVPVASMAVESDATRSFSMLLALDISTDPENLVQVQEGVKTFIEGMVAQDQLAIIVFFDEVQVAHDFTGDKKVLNATINSLGAQGNYTALNQAIVESAAMAGRLGSVPPGRKVVVIVTDSRDNVKNVARPDALSQVVETGVPIYALGYGPKIAAEELEELARLAKGQSFVLSSPDEVKGRLLDIRALLRQGYKVTFEADVQADNEEHDFTMAVTHQDQEGVAAGRLLAVSSEVAVALSGIVGGQQIGQGDRVDISAEVVARAPIASVAFTLDGEALAEKKGPPFDFVWDSTDATPGTHVLGVEAIDRVGNVGRAEARIDVVVPVLVTASALRDEVELGEEVVVQVQVDSFAPAQVSEVVFLLDGEPLGTDETPPFVFAFDSGAYTPGEYVITVLAEDNLGRTSETDLNIEFLPPPELPELPEPEVSESPDWSMIVVSVIVVAILLIALGAMVALFRSRRTRYQKDFQLEISNQGNVPSRYELQAQDSTGTFGFEFALAGTNLQLRQVPTAVVETIPHAKGDSVDGTSLTSGAKPERRMGAREVAGKAAGASGALAGILSTVSRLLPGSTGTSAARASAQLRRGQMQTGRADRLVDQVAKAKPKTSSTPAADAAPSDQATFVPYASTVASLEVEGMTGTYTAGGTSMSSGERPSDSPAWALTPSVEPGETLVVEMLVSPTKSYKSQHYPFTLLSRSVEQSGSALMAEEVSVHMTRPSWLSRLYPYLVVLLIMAVTISLYMVFLQSAGILG